ncbi:LPO_1073/Vpar_1526 family protein [Nocardia sp. NPDC050697]|uniref:LPO_1073/Vpar_1526 family protein n=1 Tax=Nocardia sp. NPDC050697 TaxID=3155158 RepID=UPI0033CBCC54
MSWFRQGQAGGDYSRQIQAAQNVYINEGIRPDEVVQICTESMRSEFEKFSLTARTMVDERAREFLENYMIRQAEAAPQHASAMQQPYMQRAVQTAQIEYVSAGDPDLGAVLVDLLVDLSKQENRSMYGTSLQAALEIAPKLTSEQMNALTVVDRIHSKIFVWPSPAEMHEAIRREVVPFLDYLPQSILDYSHMVGHGVCWMTDGGNLSVETMFLEKYPGLFTRGFERHELPPDFPEVGGLLQPALRDPKRLQISVFSSRHLTQALEMNVVGLTPEQGEAVRRAQGLNIFSVEEVLKELMSENRQMAHLASYWKRTKISRIELSTTGLIIAEANLRSKVPDAAIMPF